VGQRVTVRNRYRLLGRKTNSFLFSSEGFSHAFRFTWGGSYFLRKGFRTPFGLPGGVLILFGWVFTSLSVDLGVN